MRRSGLVPRLAWVAAALALATPARPQTVRFVNEPTGLVTGPIEVTVAAAVPVESLDLFINGVRHSAAEGRRLTARVNASLYIRRLRLRAVGYDAEGNIAGEDEMVINDPLPPFRVRLQGPETWPATGMTRLFASVLGPSDLPAARVDFFIGEENVATADRPPYLASINTELFPDAAYARVVARAGDQEANDVLFFGDPPHASAEVTVQQIPVSVAGSASPLRIETLTLLDNGVARPIETLAAATDQPLHVILLIDCSQSMLQELPVVKAAARQFAHELLRPQDRLAVVGFNQRAFWLTGFTNDWDGVAAAVDRIRPIGATHLYDSVIEMLFELQKIPGRRALVVLTDGADQGSRFELDHLVHYARYAGVPIYPVIKNRSLSRWMKLGIGRLQARRVARVAEDTGATWFIIHREAELAGVYARIARELREQYQLVFHSEADAEDHWRSLEVVSRDGQKLRAPKGYFP